MFEYKELQYKYSVWIIFYVRSDRIIIKKLIYHPGTVILSFTVSTSN